MKKIKFIFLNLSLTRKMAVTYFIAVLLPTLALAVGLYFVSLNAMQEANYQNQRYEIASASANLNIQTTHIMSSANLLQESSSLLDILGGVHPDMSHTMFYYLRDVQPLLNVANTNPHIQNIRIYGFNDMLLNMHFGLTSLRYLEMHEGFAEAVSGISGTWIVTWEDDEPLLKYYRTLYASSFPFRRGLLEFIVDINTLIEPFQNFDMESLYMITQHGEVIRYYNNDFSRYTNMTDEIQSHENHLIFDIPLQQGLPDIIISIHPMEVFYEQNLFILFILAIMITVFTTLYFLLTKFITTRLQSFKQHIQSTDIENLKPFDSESKDEIGVVVSSYNHLVARTNTLIHENLIAQLKKKEAEYYALQSQIKPHFLYNTLENIRMSAETNEDIDTAEMLATLGKHMRYSLNMSNHPIRLEEELFSAQNFLQIHKIRMKEKIHYDIEVSTEINDIFVPRFLLQPLLENAIQHGYRLEKQLCINICVIDGEEQQKPDVILVIIQDNGNGIEEKQLHQLQEKLKNKETEATHHIGLLNVNSRVSTFYNFEEECILLESEENIGTKITIMLKKEGFSRENISS